MPDKSFFLKIKHLSRYSEVLSMTEMKFQEIMNKNRCPAEYVCEVEGQPIPIDCERCGYDCRKCVEGHINDDK